MIKKMFLFGAMLSLVGCTTTGGISSIDPATLAAIQQAAVTECAFLPTEVQIASLFPSISSQTAVGSQVADLICKAVVAQIPVPAKRRLSATLGAAITVQITLPDGKTAKVVGTFVNKQSHHKE